MAGPIWLGGNNRKWREHGCQAATLQQQLESLENGGSIIIKAYKQGSGDVVIALKSLSQ